MKNFKLATYNVNSIRSRLHIVIPWMREFLPDILCMQETKVNNEQFPVNSFAEIGYQIYFSGSGRYNGVAIASREHAQDVSHGFPDDCTDADRLITAKFPQLTIINAYVPQGREKDSPHFAYKLKWFEHFYEMLCANFHPDEMLLVCGDLNVAPDPFDVHNPARLRGHVCFTEEVWDVYRQWQIWGLNDIFRKFHPQEEGCFSFFDYRVPNAIDKGLGWRIDHILATKPLSDKATNCVIDTAPRRATKPSDHTPIIATFVL
ncbi:MAG: exodeoxyribonuclease III [Deltaproteobacteria bacterium]